MVCAFAIAAVSGLVYPTVASDRLDNARVRAFEKIDPAWEYAETSRLVVAKGLDLIESMSNEVVAKVTTSSLILGFVAAVVLAVSIYWSRIVGLVRRARHGRTLVRPNRHTFLFVHSQRPRSDESPVPCPSTK